MLNGAKGRRRVVALLLAWATARLTAVECQKCPLYESVDLTNSTEHANGSYSYEGLLIPPEWIEDFVIENEGQKRGCICKVKPCVSLCCANPQAQLNMQNAECLAELRNITVGNTIGNSSLKANFNDLFPVHGHGCEGVYPYFFDQPEDQIWHLDEKGNVHTSTIVFQVGQYCLHPDDVGTSDEYAYNLYDCSMANIRTDPEIALKWIMFVSVICLVVTTLIYLLLGKKTVNQNLFICYLVALSISFFIFDINFFFNKLEDICLPLAFINYFALMTAFCTLTVISVSMWNKFRGNNFYVPPSQSKKRLFVYYSFAFGGAFLLTLGTALAQFSSIDDDLKPRIAVESCWISTDRAYPAFIYLYGPMSVLILINLSMFSLTVVRIFKLRKQANFAKNSRPFSKTLRFGEEFRLYLRIFFTMGIPWIFEIVFREESSLTFYVINILNASQGIIIFIMFGNVQLLYNRFMRRKTDDSNNFSVQSSGMQQTCQRLLHSEHF